MPTGAPASVSDDGRLKKLRKLSRELGSSALELFCASIGSMAPNCHSIGNIVSGIVDVQLSISLIVLCRRVRGHRRVLSRASTSEAVLVVVT